MKIDRTWINGIRKESFFFYISLAIIFHLFYLFLWAVVCVDITYFGFIALVLRYSCLFYANGYFLRNIFQFFVYFNCLLLISAIFQLILRELRIFFSSSSRFPPKVLNFRCFCLFSLILLVNNLWLLNLNLILLNLYNKFYFVILHHFKFKEKTASTEIGT